MPLISLEVTRDPERKYSLSEEFSLIRSLIHPYVLQHIKHLVFIHKGARTQNSDKKMKTLLYHKEKEIPNKTCSLPAVGLCPEHSSLIYSPYHNSSNTTQGLFYICWICCIPRQDTRQCYFSYGSPKRWNSTFARNLILDQSHRKKSVTSFLT